MPKLAVFLVGSREEMNVQHNIFPVTIIQDRYGGCYSGGAWIAIAAGDHLENGAYRVVRCLEDGPHGDDTESQTFWSNPPSWIAVGSSPDEAVKNLQAAFSSTAT